MIGLKTLSIWFWIIILNVLDQIISKWYHGLWISLANLSLHLLQVQSDHFEEFFAPELDKHGYQALYKKNTSEVPFTIFFLLNFMKLCFLFIFKLPLLVQVYSGNFNAVDGCATFFRRDRFSHVKKYEVNVLWFFLTVGHSFSELFWSVYRLSLIRLHSL